MYILLIYRIGNEINFTASEFFLHSFILNFQQSLEPEKSTAVKYLISFPFDVPRKDLDFLITLLDVIHKITK